VSKDKRAYNKFNFQLRKAPEEVKDEWKRLQKDGTEDDKDAFMRDLIDAQKGGLDKVLLRCKSVVQESMQGETGAWISWAEASTKEGGDDILHEMIKAKTLSIRRNPKLPPNSSVPWPRNQQVAHTSEVWSDCTTTKDGQNLKEEENEDEQEKDFLNQFEAIK